MPKSRNRARPASRPAAVRPKQRSWVKWLALILPGALLLGTLAGIFGVGSSAAAVPPSVPQSSVAGR
jgi:uncharacterized membrane protein YfcA